jgi:hypothetical protein
VTAALHLPVDFERLESVRLLGRKLAAIDATHGELAPLYALRVWVDWAIGGKTYRPLQNKPAGAARDHDWTRENITFVLEDAAKWRGETGALVVAMLDAGFIRAIVSPEGEHEIVVLSLEGFWRWNEHLSPNYKSIQRRGAEAANLRKMLDKIGDMARERRQVFDSQGVLPFGAGAPTDEEQEACYALFMRLHRECGLDLPNASDFTEAAMSDALRVVREFTPEEIAKVEQYVIDHAADVDFVKKPARLLENFQNLLALARRAG